MVEFRFTVLENSRGGAGGGTGMESLFERYEKVWR